MTTKSMTMWTVLCNVCGADALESSDYSAYADLDTPIEEAQEADWLVRRYGEFVVCAGDIAKRACRIFGHLPTVKKWSYRTGVEDPVVWHCPRCGLVGDPPENQEDVSGKESK